MASQRICLSVAPENDAQSSSAMSFLTLPGNSASWNTSTGALLTELKKLSAAEALKGEPIDLLINNAGKGGGIPDVTKADIMKLLEVNAVSPFQIYLG
ncbi:hypothetical protein PR002_g21943 [Phytophthora rubi]|uniref:Uncharacterized protein n=1 Tax=Phytophthora rubi TaxID=129364 RepID=A0A6A3J0S7_9STRA|nr:hypothetical protein PF003_g12575 [Phytophthora fragariae]KAE8987812.1 hypothetical protein PR002_g21943 [Phytophthora rubi]